MKRLIRFMSHVAPGQSATAVRRSVASRGGVAGLYFLGGHGTSDGGAVEHGEHDTARRHGLGAEPSARAGTRQRRRAPPRTLMDHAEVAARTSVRASASLWWN